MQKKFKVKKIKKKIQKNSNNFKTLNLKIFLE